MLCYVYSPLNSTAEWPLPRASILHRHWTHSSSFETPPNKCRSDGSKRRDYGRM